MRVFSLAKALRTSDSATNIVFALVNGTQVHMLCGGPLFHDNGTVESLTRLVQKKMGSSVSNNAIKKALKMANEIPRNCSAEELGRLSHL